MNNKLPADLRDPLDFSTANTVLQESVLAAFQNQPKQSYGDHTLEFSDFSYPSKMNFSLKEQKDALLSQSSLSIPLKGTVTLRNNETGLPVAKKRTTIMRTPLLTQRGTYILGGSEYSLALQKRLRPGVYTRQTANKEYETFIKTKGGTGFNIVMDPNSGELSFKIYNSKTPMYTVMRGLGMTDDEIKETMGDDLFKINYKKKYQSALPKVWAKVTRGRKETDDVERDLAGEFEKMELDENTTLKTLGKPYKTVSKDVFKDSVRNLLSTYRGEREVDDRDSYSFQRVLGPEDIFSEGILRDKAGIARNILYRAQKTKNLDHLHSNVFKNIPDHVFHGSRLGQSLEEINLIDAIDSNTKITGMGEGVFGSDHGVPESARMVTPTQLGYVDIIRTPESGSVGVDSRLSVNTYKGIDGNLYSQFIGKDGKPEYVSSSRIDDLVIAFPGDAGKVVDGKQPKVRAVNKGIVDYVDPGEVDYTLPSGQEMFSLSANLIPYISGVKGMRGLMGSKYQSQALSLPNREAPRVQSLSEDGRSFQRIAAEKVGAIWSKQSGEVLDVTPDNLKVQYDDGEVEDIELYNDFPLNRKSLIRQTVLLKPGERFAKDSAIVDSNYTQNGQLALGTHLRVAYMDMKGMNHEDAGIIRETAAKKLSSEHLYTEKLDPDSSTSTDLGKFMSIFSGTYTKDQLKNLSEDGVIKKGAIIHENDPVILNMKKRSHKGLGMIGGGKGSQWKDNTVVWDKEHEGIVTDVWHDKSGVKVAIKAIAPMHVGDKLCFSEDHELYTTNRGWQPVEKIKVSDTMLSLDLDSLSIEHSEVRVANGFRHIGSLFTIDLPKVSMSVTLKHKLVASYDGAHFGLYTAEELLQSEVFWLLSGAMMEPVLISVEDDITMEDYDGWVYCPTLDKYHTLLTKRKGLVHWSGNSGSFGNKSIVSKIVPDDQMPKGADGQPLDYLVNPFGTIGRHNPAQIVEAQLAKIARQTGENYVLPAFSDENAIDMVQNELDKAGISATEEISLPEGRKVNNVMTGDGYYFKLHHMATDKRSEVGEGSFNLGSVPTVGSDGAKPKRVGTLEMEALLAHGAPAVVRDSKLVRGQENRDYFRDLMEGKTPRMPKVSPTYKRFIATLQSSGIRVSPKEGKGGTTALQLTAMTDEDVLKISNGEITAGDTIKWKSRYGKNLRGEADMDPVDNGLFDRGITGGMGGDRFSHISLPTKLPQPVFEKQIRSILGITEKQLHQVITGQHSLGDYGTGPKGLEAALSGIDVTKKIEELSALYKSADRPSVKDKLAKQLRAYKGLRSQGLSPNQLLTSKVLVIPPIFRPVSVTSDFEIIADSNLLYKDLMDAKTNYNDMEGVVGEDMRSEGLLSLYKAYKAVTGLGQPIKKDRVEKKVKGLLADVFGPNGNKTSLVQRNLTGTPTTYSGRGVIIPDPNLTIDEIGLPWGQAWELFAPFVVKRLISGTDGSPSAKKKALDDIENHRDNAKHALLAEMKERPVMYSRAPVLHKYGLLAGFAVPVNGDALRANVPTLAGAGADFDGDTYQVHTIVTPEAVNEAKEKMLPSKHLFSVADFKLMHTPGHGFNMGIYSLGGRRGKRGRIVTERSFKNTEELMAAYSRGDVSLEDDVVIEDD